MGPRCPYQAKLVSADGIDLGVDGPSDRILPNAPAPSSAARQQRLTQIFMRETNIMPTATLNLTVVSKRMLTKREAAEHCGRPLRIFDLECPVSPVKFANGDLRWDLRDLDAWLDTLKTGIDDVDAIVDRLG
jgi:hypothetical protein